MSVRRKINRIKYLLDENNKVIDTIQCVDGSKYYFTNYKGNNCQLDLLCKVLRGGKGYSSEPLPREKETPNGGNLHRLIWSIQNIKKEVE